MMNSRRKRGVWSFYITQSWSLRQLQSRVNALKLRTKYIFLKAKQDNFRLDLPPLSFQTYIWPSGDFVSQIVRMPRESLLIWNSFSCGIIWLSGFFSLFYGSFCNWQEWALLFFESTFKLNSFWRGMEERWSEGHSCEIFLPFWDILWAAWLYHPLFLVEVAEHNRVQYSRNEDERDFLVVAVFKGKSRAFHITGLLNWTDSGL